MKTHISILLSCFLFSACSGSISLVNINEETSVEIPRLEKFSHDPKPQVATVGDYMISNGSSGSYAVDRAHLSAKLAESAQLEVPHKLRVFRFNLPANTLKLEGTSHLGRHYRYPGVFQTSSGDRAYGGLITSNTNSGKVTATQMYWKWHDNPLKEFYSAPISNPPTVSIESAISEETRRISVTATRALIYAGISDGKINFIYHEFTPGGHLKPDFSQNITLDYKPSTEYAFKSARFLVVSASVSQIEFKLLDPLR